MNIELERFTLAQAALLDPDDLSELTAEHLDISREARIATAELWVHLCGVDSVELRNAAMNEAMNDGELLVRLNMPAVEFVDWFRRTDWEFFELYEAIGDSDAWAWGVLDRARAISAGMGDMARQCALRLPANRF